MTHSAQMRSRGNASRLLWASRLQSALRLPGARWLTGPALLLLMGHWCVAAAAQDTTTAAQDTTTAAQDAFTREIAPLLTKRCLECHKSPDPAGGLDLTTHAGLLAGGDSGPAVDLQSAEGSLLLVRIRAGEMPPARQGLSQALPADEVALLESWVAAGAGWPRERPLDWFEYTNDRRAGRDWWSLQPLAETPVPSVATAQVLHAAPAFTPVDAFIGQTLAEHRFEPAPVANAVTLVRRLYVDLLGLPPTADEVARYAADTEPDAAARLADRLLASPHFGERQARPWLDVARYADTCGYERDQPKPGIWKYRDWVVQAFNHNLPYDQFVQAQLAGDELPDRTEQTVIATGFLRLGTWNDEPNDPFEYQFERLEDMVHATSTAFLGITLRCARCHDHKYDPFPQTDYYRLASAFWAGYVQPGAGKLLGGPDPEQLGYDVFGWTDAGTTPAVLTTFKKGDPHQPGAPVTPAWLSCFDAQGQPAELDLPPANARTTHLRLQFAKRIAAHPLASRVEVNRVWQSHVGQGLVRTPDNFGFLGDRPSHPQLLEYLAGRFQERAYDLKWLHRLLVTSRVYQQQSVHPRQAEYETTDAGNRALWRAERRRVEAEVMRDSILLASGQLDRQLGGECFKPQIAKEALEGLSRKTQAWEATPPQTQGRRSLYIFQQRSLLVPLLTTFDATDTTLPCGQRNVTTVVPQALALLNNAFVHEQSLVISGRVAQQAGADPQAQVRQAWRLVLGRDPSPTEAAAALEHLKRQTTRFESRATLGPLPAGNARNQALASLCQVLFNTNEFVYVD